MSKVEGKSIDEFIEECIRDGLFTREEIEKYKEELHEDILSGVLSFEQDYIEIPKDIDSSEEFYKWLHEL